MKNLLKHQRDSYQNDLVATNESKETKTYEEIWIKSRELTGLITKNSDDHDGKYMNIKCNWEDELPLN